MLSLSFICFHYHLFTSIIIYLLPLSFICFHYQYIYFHYHLFASIIIHIYNLFASIIINIFASMLLSWFSLSFANTSIYLLFTCVLIWLEFYKHIIIINIFAIWLVQTSYHCFGYNIYYCFFNSFKVSPLEFYKYVIYIVLTAFELCKIQFPIVWQRETPNRLELFFLFCSLGWKVFRLKHVLLKGLWELVI